MKKHSRYGFSDLILEKGIKVQKYVSVYDNEGNKVGEIQTYFIEDEEE